MLEPERRRRVSRHGRPIGRQRAWTGTATGTRPTTTPRIRPTPDVDEPEPESHAGHDDQALLTIARIMLDHLARNGAATEPHMFGIGGAAEASQELYDMAALASLTDAAAAADAETKETKASSFRQEQLSHYSLHTIGHCLKRIVRTLPIVTAHDWQHIQHVYSKRRPDEDGSAVMEMLDTESSLNKLFLVELLALLARVSLNERETMMTSRRLGYVFGLALLASLKDATRSATPPLPTTHEASDIIALLIEHNARHLLLLPLQFADNTTTTTTTTTTTSFCKAPAPKKKKKKTLSREIVVSPNVEIRLYPSDAFHETSSADAVRSPPHRLVRKSASEPPPSAPFRFSPPPPPLPAAAEHGSMRYHPLSAMEHRDVLKHHRLSAGSDVVVAPARGKLASPPASSFIHRHGSTLAFSSSFVQPQPQPHPHPQEEEMVSVDPDESFLLGVSRSRSKSASEASGGRSRRRSRSRRRKSLNRITSMATTFSRHNGFIDSDAVTTAESELQRLVPLRIVDDDDDDEDDDDDDVCEVVDVRETARLRSLSWKHSFPDIDTDELGGGDEKDAMRSLQPSHDGCADVKREECPTTISSSSSSSEFDATRDWAKARWKSMNNIMRRPSIESPSQPRPSCPIDELVPTSANASEARPPRGRDGLDEQEERVATTTFEPNAPRSNSATYSAQQFAGVNHGHQRTASTPAPMVAEAALASMSRRLRGFGSTDFSSRTTNDDGDDFGVVPFRIVDVNPSNLVEVAPGDVFDTAGGRQSSHFIGLHQTDEKKDSIDIVDDDDEDMSIRLRNQPTMQSPTDSSLLVIREEDEVESVGRDHDDDDDNDDSTRFRSRSQQERASSSGGGGIKASTVVSMRFEDLPLNVDAELCDASQALWRRAYNEHNSSKLRRSQSRRSSVVDELDDIDGSVSRRSTPPLRDQQLPMSQEFFSRPSRHPQRPSTVAQTPLPASVPLVSVRSPSRLLRALQALREPIRHVQESWSDAATDATPASIIASETGAKLAQRFNRLDDVVRTLVDRNRDATEAAMVPTTTTMSSRSVVVTLIMIVVNVAMLLSVLPFVVRTQAVYDALDVGTIAFVASLSWPLLRWPILASTSVAAFSTLLMPLSAAFFTAVFVMSCGCSLSRLVSALCAYTNGRNTISFVTVTSTVLVGVYLAFALHAHLASLPTLVVGVGLASTHVLCTMSLFKHLDDRSSSPSSSSSSRRMRLVLRPSSIVRTLALAMLVAVVYVSDYVPTFVFGVIIVSSTCSTLLPPLETLSLLVVFLLSLVVVDVSLPLALASGSSVGVYVASLSSAWSRSMMMMRLDVDLFLLAASTFSFGSFLISVLIESFLAVDKRVYVVMTSAAMMGIASRLRCNML